MYKIPLCCKNSVASDLCFSPRTKIVWGPEAFHTVKSRQSGWVLLLGEPQGAPSLVATPTSSPTGSIPCPESPPLSHQYLHSGLVPTCFVLCAYFLVLFLPDQKRKIQKGRPKVSHPIKTLAFFQSGSGCLGNQVLTESNSFSLFFLD